MVSVITVNYNNTQVTLELLESLYAHEVNAVEVIVVDNASRENPERYIKEKFPLVKFIRSERNLGFAGGNNLGIAQATGDHLFFVNNDTAFTTPIISQLVKVLEEDKTIGAVCPILVYPSGKIQFAGFTPINAWTGRNKCLTSPASAELKVNTSYAHGAAFMISRALLQQIGNMPEHYFLYFEELDWSAKITQLNFKIVVLTTTQLIHKESQTVGSFSELKSYFMSRNRLLFMRRNYSRTSLTFFWFYFLLVASPMHIVRYLMSGNWNCVRAHLAGIFWNIRWSGDSLTLGYKYNHLNQI
ncbi:MAG: glycosyltransferase family 2 protein [Cytophagia bacterium]|nr:glycosyltransferase family 2 protein [Cytophagia bacterium]